MRIAFVITRYGADVVGGQESETREFAERLAARGHQVSVLSTCVRSLVTWANDVAPGVTIENGVRVERFPAQGRDHVLVGRLQHAIDAGLGLPEHLERPWGRN